MTNEEIIREAKARFKAAQDWESKARINYLDDTKFAEGDSRNNWQWPEAHLNDRQVSNRPTLTINKTRQHCIQVINDARQNKVEVKYSPTAGGANYESAQVLNGIARQIAYSSNADAAMLTAVGTQVKGGWGYWRLKTAYVSEKSFDQEIRWVRIADPLTVYLDPDIQERDGSDARFGFVFVDKAREVIEKEFPQFKNGGAGENAVSGSAGWITKDHIRDCEYFRKRVKDDVLIADAQGNVYLKSAIGAEIAEALLEDPTAQKRKVQSEDVEWYRIIGDEIVEKNIWPGKYIPLFRVIGEETIIEGELDRKGHVRSQIDPQRMYNFYSSSATELFALQPKAPYIATVEAVANQPYWNQANTVNFSVLTYNGYDAQGRPLPPPQRQQPPPMSQEVLQGLQISAAEMQMASGQYQATMGEPSNEKSGRAINERQRQGDNATYHYIDHLADAVRFTGKAILDLIPKIYDTRRVLKIMGVDGSEDTVILDPQAKQAYVEHEKEIEAGAKKVLNPTIGSYSVQADVGPAYGTARQEAYNALIQLAGMSPEFMAVAADLIVKAADFPMADELSERLERMIPPQAMGGPSPQMLQAHQQITKLTGALQQSMQSLAEEKAKRTGQEQQKGIDLYRAETDRIDALKDVDPAVLIPLLRQLVAEAISNPIAPIDASIAQAVAMHPMPFAPGQAVAPPAPAQQPQQPGA